MCTFPVFWNDYTFSFINNRVIVMELWQLSHQKLLRSLLYFGTKYERWLPKVPHGALVTHILQ